MPESFDLSSATGRKATEAGLDAIGVSSKVRETVPAIIAAALAVYEDPACPTCEGQGWVQIPWSIADPRGGTQCPTCNGTGQNPDQLVELSEVVKQIKEWPASMDYPLSVTQREGVASALERWARERPA